MITHSHDYDPMFDEPCDDREPVCTLGELAKEMGANEASLSSIRRRVYKDTACGASLGVDTGAGACWDDDQTVQPNAPVYEIFLSGYVEGTDAECPTHKTSAKEGWKEWLRVKMEQVDIDADDLEAEIEEDEDDEDEDG